MYVSREWCLEEVISVKWHQMECLVFDRIPLFSLKLCSLFDGFMVSTAILMAYILGLLLGKMGKKCILNQFGEEKNLWLDNNVEDFLYYEVS